MMNTDDKHFLKYNQQMKHLREKGIDCRGSKNKTTLSRAGYFNLINGYKNPFVQRKDPTTNQHIYYPNTTIDNIKYVYDFDEELRILLFRVLTRVENEVRTITGYQFDLTNFPTRTWTDANSYDTNDKMEAVKIISKIYSELSINKFEYVQFYYEEHNFIPSWILVKAIKFETFINFLRICKPNIKDSICNLYHILDNQGRPFHNLLFNMLHWIKKVRNACAHNERVYTLCKENSRINEPYLLMLPNAYSRERKQKIFDIIIYLKYFLQPNEYEELLDSLKSLFNNLSPKCSQNVFENIKNSFGIKNISDFDILKSNQNIKNYNNY